MVCLDEMCIWISSKTDPKIMEIVELVFKIKKHGFDGVWGGAGLKRKTISGF